MWLSHLTGLTIDKNQRVMPDKAVVYLDRTPKRDGLTFTASACARDVNNFMFGGFDVARVTSCETSTTFQARMDATSNLQRLDNSFRASPAPPFLPPVPVPSSASAPMSSTRHPFRSRVFPRPPAMSSREYEFHGEEWWQEQEQEQGCQEQEPASAPRQAPGVSRTCSWLEYVTINTGSQRGTDSWLYVPLLLTAMGLGGLSVAVYPFQRPARWHDVVSRICAAIVAKNPVDGSAHLLQHLAPVEVGREGYISAPDQERLIGEDRTLGQYLSHWIARVRCRGGDWEILAGDLPEIPAADMHDLQIAGLVEVG